VATAGREVKADCEVWRECQITETVGFEVLENVDSLLQPGYWRIGPVSFDTSSEREMKLRSGDVDFNEVPVIIRRFQGWR
jgi:hypothetical protein